MNTIWINGSFKDAQEAVVKAGDLGLQRGYGVFDFFRLVNGKPFLWDHYWERFTASSQALGLTLPYAPEQLKEVVRELIEANNLEDAGIKLTLTGGYAADGYSPVAPNLIITTHQLKPPLSQQYQQGIKVITHEYQRELPHVKTTNYLQGILLLPLLKKKGVDEALYHHKGRITEFPRCNFFIVKDGVLMTPGDHILMGITRKCVSVLHPLQETDIHLDDLAKADEAFLTSTTRGILPIVEVDGRKIGNGKPGAISRGLMDALKDLQNLCPESIPLTKS